MKKVGILGSGPVAKALGNGFLKHGYSVMLGSRSIEKLADWKAAGGAHASTGSFEDAARFGSIIVLAVKGSVAAEVIEQAGPQNLAGKTVIDTTNPIAAAPPEDGVLRFFSTMEESLMEHLQTRFPLLHFVKAFNSIGNGFMVNPSFKDGTPTMFICGNNDAAKDEVKSILTQFDWETWDMGKAAAARAIEPLCMLWCIPGLLHNQWSHAFKLMKA
ncbi:NADPH-dependent F420 reductase [Chitinophagaceae bacterium MMS25-I14]